MPEITDILVKVKKLHSQAKFPIYAHKGDSCCDLYTVEDVTLPPGGRKLVPTGIAIQMAPGFGAHIQPRSGNAWKKGLSVLNSPGEIDNGYINEIKVILYNASDKAVTILQGEAIAQMGFHPVYTGNFLEVSEFEETDRGMNGFGSTGVVGDKKN